MAKSKQQQAKAKAQAAKKGNNKNNNKSKQSSGGSTPQSAINSWAGNNKGNDMVAGMANDLFYNSANAAIQTESDVNYVRQMAPEALNYQRQSQNILTQADLTRMSAEGAITQDLLRTQGDYQLKDTTIQADAQKYGYDKQAQASMYGADRQVDSTRIQADASKYGADRELESNKYVADQGLEGTRVKAGAEMYGYDKQLEGSKYTADRGLEATRYSKDSDERVAFGSYASAEKQIGLRGEEDRKTLRQGTDETLRLRADARGAIRRAGARFYG